MRIDHEIDGLSFPVDDADRNRISGALFNIVLEHSKAIVVLFENKLHTSALALMRPLFESFIRAEWILCCASEKEINLLIEKDEFKNTMGDMLEAVEIQKEWPDTLSEVKNNALKAMHSFTHGGFVPISRHIQDGSIEAVFNTVEIEASLQLVSYLSFMAYNDMIEMSGNVEKHKGLNEIFKWLSEWFVPTVPESEKPGDSK